MGAARNREQEKLPWLGAVERVKLAGDAQRWRLACLRTETRWREFVVAWESCANELRIAGADNVVSIAGKSEDMILAECWRLVEDEASAALILVDERTEIATADLPRMYEKLRGSKIIYPDGSVHALALDRITREQEMADMKTLAQTRHDTFNVLDYGNRIRVLQNKDKRGAKP